MQAVSIAFGFFNRSRQDQKNLTIFSLESIIKPTQLGGMAAALHSVVFAYEEQIDFAFGTVISQRNLGAVA